MLLILILILDTISIKYILILFYIRHQHIAYIGMRMYNKNVQYVKLSLIFCLNVLK